MGSYGRMTRAGFLFLAGCVAASSLTTLAHGQVAYPEEEARVRDLPALTARTAHASDVLTTSLEMLFNDREVCCGKDSALEDSVESADPKSLKDIASKLQGRHLLSDGRAMMVTTEFLTPDQVNAGHLITMIRNQRAALMMWNSRVYVLYGVTYVRTVDYSTNEIAYAVHKFLLQDVRFSDSRRAVSFDRLTEDAGKVQGLLFVQAARP
jgi:hypothetical protein